MSNNPEMKKKCIHYDKGFCYNAILGKYCFENSGLWCDYCFVPKITKEDIERILDEEIVLIKAERADDTDISIGYGNAVKKIYDLIK